MLGKGIIALVLCDLNNCVIIGVVIVCASALEINSTEVELFCVERNYVLALVLKKNFRRL